MNMVHSLHNGLWTIRPLHRIKRRKRNPKEEETEAQIGGNNMKMVIPLNDTLNGPKHDEYGALSPQQFMDHPTLSSHKEDETEAQNGENGTKMVLAENYTPNG